MKVFYEPYGDKLFLEVEDRLVILCSDFSTKTALAYELKGPYAEQLIERLVGQDRIFQIPVAPYNLVGAHGDPSILTIEAISDNPGKQLATIETSPHGDIDGSGILVRIGSQVHHAGTIFDRFPDRFSETKSIGEQDQVRGTVKQCPACKGLKRSQIPGLEGPCLGCSGLGFVNVDIPDPFQGEPRKPCLSCFGTGFKDLDECTLRCPNCQGTGYANA